MKKKLLSAFIITSMALSLPLAAEMRKPIMQERLMHPMLVEIQSLQQRRLP